MSNAISIPANVAYLSVTESSREVILSTLRETFPDMHPAGTDIIQTTLSGCMANFSYMLISNPTNVVLAKLVTQRAGSRLRFVDVSRNILRTHGLVGFTHGFGSNFLYGASTSAVWWWLYSGTRRLYNGGGGVEGDAVCGLVSGVLSTLLLHPLDTIVSKIMAGAVKKLTAVGALREVLASPGGVRLLWRGVVPSVVGSALSSSLFAVCYEIIKRSARLEVDGE